MKKIISIIICVIMLLGLIAGCSNNNNDTKNTTKVDFWGWGTPEEIQVFKKLVDNFNALNLGITVNYVQKPSDGYQSTTAQALSGKRGPDVVFVGDAYLKEWASLDLISPLDELVSKSKTIKISDMWETGINRYRYDKATKQSRSTDPLYALPKDVAPTAIYYNRDIMKSVGIDEISVFQSDVAKYNNEHSLKYPERGFFLVGSDGTPITIEDMKVSVDAIKGAAKRVFNNKIAMTWEECVALAKLMTKSYNPNSKSDYGYFTEWWFNYGWSVSGDCIKYDEKEGVWKFTLGSEEVIKNTQGKAMPTMRQAFTHFVSLSAKKGVDVDGKGTLGLEITPTPDTLNTVGKSGYFTDEKVAMMVDIRAATVIYRKNANFDWDVAPLPKAKDGVESGHSSSMGLSISSKSSVKEQAWQFVEYLAGEKGQTAMAETGFNVPNQKSLANSPSFLNSDKKPANSIIFVKAMEFQRPADWTYLPDNLWIEKWAPFLNDNVRNQKANLTQFFDTVTQRTNDTLKLYTK